MWVHRSEEKCIQGIGGKARRKETTRNTLDAGRKIILNQILEKQDGVVRNGFIWLGIGTNGRGGSCEHSNESSDPIKCWEIIE
jgi:hypothetical protein